VEQQTALVTGATDGLGRALARELAAEGALVLVHGRDPARVEDTLRELADGRARGYVADVSSLAQVRRLAREVERDCPRLDLLVNNAGIGGGRRGAGRQLSADGYELRFAVNYLSTFLLTVLLLPLLRRSAPARVVNVASAGQVPIDFDDVMIERGYSGMRAYAQSKLAQIMFTFELAERLRAEGAGVTVNALHPASLMDTKIVDESFGYTLSTVQDGVAATLRLVLDPELDGVSGRYYDGLRESQAEAQADDAAARERLWALSQQLVGLDASAQSA
jgi:NAD(P)-dependent dehydrogenase (short-subunit alcohol dehydrogenase family)